MKFLSNTLYLFLLTLCSITANSQTDWQWGQEVRNDALDLATDPYGNTYVTWSLEDAFTIDGETFFSNGNNDAALTSFDCDGTHRWTKVIGGVNGDSPQSVGTDSLGGVYAAFLINSARMADYDVALDTDTTITVNRNGYLIIKYDVEGMLEWFRLPEDTVVFNFPDDLVLGVPYEIDVAPNGEIFIYSKLFPGLYGGGVFEATFEAGLSGSGNDVYSLNYDGDGNCMGGVHFDITYEGGLFNKSNFKRDHNSGRFYLAGNRNEDDEVVIGGDPITANNYLVQFDQDGNENWTISFEDSDSPQTGLVGKACAVDRNRKCLYNRSILMMGIAAWRTFTFHNTLIGSSWFSNSSQRLMTGGNVDLMHRMHLQ